MLTLTELALLALVGYRGTQLIVHDTILDVPRGWAFRWHGRKDTSPVRTALITLISCVYCMGWWVSGAALFGYLAATGGLDQHPAVIALEWFAVAGGQALLNRWDDSRKDATG